MTSRSPWDFERADRRNADDDYSGGKGEPVIPLLKQTAAERSYQRLDSIAWNERRGTQMDGYHRPINTPKLGGEAQARRASPVRF